MARRKRVYLAGPMRGIPEFNFPAFADATQKLREIGYEVVSPAEHDLDNGLKPSPTGKTNIKLKHFLARDLPLMLQCDEVIVLPGWSKSKGATTEVYAARKCDMPVRALRKVLKDV